LAFSGANENEETVGNKACLAVSARKKNNHLLQDQSRKESVKKFQHCGRR
jgi:hypothetical protein